MVVGTNTACARRWGQELGQDLGSTTLHSEEARMAARAQPKKLFANVLTYAVAYAVSDPSWRRRKNRAVPWLSCTRAGQAPDHIAMDCLVRKHIQRRRCAAAAAAAAPAAASRRSAAACGRRIACSGCGPRRVGAPRSAALARAARTCGRRAGGRVGIGAEHCGGKVATAGEQHHPGPRRTPERLQRGGERARRACRGRRRQQRPPHGKVPPVCASRRAGPTSCAARRQHSCAGGSHAHDLVVHYFCWRLGGGS